MGFLIDKLDSDLGLPVTVVPFKLLAETSCETLSQREGGWSLIDFDKGLLSLSPRELKEKIQPEILELIKQQRLNRLVEGTCFRKLNSRRRQGTVQTVQSAFLLSLLSRH